MNISKQSPLFVVDVNTGNESWHFKQEETKLALFIQEEKSGHKIKVFLKAHSISFTQFA